MAEHRARELGKEALDEIEPGPMGRGEGEGKATRGLGRKPCGGLARDVCRMVVEDDLDRGIGRIGGVHELKKLDELPTAVPVFDQGMDMTTKQIDASHQ